MNSSILNPSKKPLDEGMWRLDSVCLVLAGQAALVAGLWAGPTLEWPVPEGGNGHFYEVVHEPGGISWEDARDAANLAGGYLVTVQSSAENAFVWSLVKDRGELWYVDGANNTIGPWLGGFQGDGAPEPAGGWQWVVATEPFEYNSWAGGEPNDAGGAEHRLSYFGHGPDNRAATWNDLPVHPWKGVLGYVVEYDPPGPPAGPALAITGSSILNGSVGQPFSYRITTNLPALSFAVSELPDGLNLDSSSGSITGTPGSAGIFPAVLTATATDGSATLPVVVHVSGGEVAVFNNNNPAGVLNHPPVATTFTLPSATLVTYLMDYHYFNGGTPPGTIALHHDDGSVFGPWQTEGRIGQGGVSNAYWETWPMAMLPAGTYTVVDSSPETWSWNSSSQNMGITTIRGIQQGGDPAALFAAWTANIGLTGEDAEPGADPDGDGTPSWIEAGTGGHPLRREMVPPGLQLTTIDGRHAVSYRACTGGIGVAGSNLTVNGVRILLEVSQSMSVGSWSRSIDFLDVADADRIDNGDGTETVVVPVKDGAIAAGGRWFVRERFLPVMPTPP